MTRPAVRLAATAALLALGGCDQLSNRKVLAAALLEVPGGAAGPTRIPGIVRAQVFLGERADLAAAASEAPRGLAGATVTVTWKEGGASRTVALPPGADAGSYWEDDSAIPDLHYVPEATYTFRAVLGDDEYSAVVTAPPRVRIRELSAAPGNVVTATRASLASLRLTADGGAAGDLAFFAAYRDPRGGILDVKSLDDQYVTCTNLPRDGQVSELVDLVVDPVRFETTSFELAPAECFPDAGTYAVGLFAARKGLVSSNLFLGAVVAGTGDTGAVEVQ